MKYLKAFTILFSLLCGPGFFFVPNLQASEHDILLGQLRRDDWVSFFSSPYAKAQVDGDFDTLLSIVKNKGIDWKIRIRGIILIGESSDPRRADILVRMFHNPFFNAECPSIKTSIITAMASVEKSRYVIDTLIEAISDRELLVREAAIKVLGQTGNERAVAPLLDELHDQNFSIRLNAIRSLGRINDRRAIPPLKKLSESEKDEFIKAEAAEALARMKA